MKGENSLDPNSLDFWCKLCNRKYLGRDKLWIHLRRVHKMGLPKHNLNIELDPNDSNFYCKSCNVHPFKLKQNPNTEPRPSNLNSIYYKSCDLNYLKFYCKSCGKKRSKFRM